MKNHLLYYLFIAFVAVSCGSMYVEYDYDQKTNFKQYRFYAFNEESGLSELDEKRFVRYTDSILQSKGLVLSENPDVLVFIASEEFETQSRNTLGVGLGGGGGNLGVGIGGGIPVGGRELHKRIQVSFISTTSNSVIWEALSESDLKKKSTPIQRDAYFKKLAAKIFKKYPPEQ